MTKEEEAALAKKDAEEKEAEEAKKKADAEAGNKLDKILAGLGDAMGRMDAMDERFKKMDAEDAKRKADAEEEERKKGDPERLAADKAKKDAEDEKEKEEAKKKADADLDDVKKRIADVAAQLPKAMTDADHAALADAQARADDIFHPLGGRAPRPLDGETVIGYERRVTAKLKEHSATWKSIDLASIPDAVFEPIRNSIYNDALAAANSPASIPPGQLRAITTTTASGHRHTKFAGRPRDWMAQFAGRTAQNCVAINPKGSH